MTTAITIGSYKMPEMVALNVACCRRVFGEEAPILISDDLSHRSEDIRVWAEANGVGYLGSESRRSHFGGDIQSIINSVVFAESCGADCGIKLSQRLIPIADGFRTALEEAMADPEVKVVVPGQILDQQIARPGAKFYAKFGLLTDCLAIRTGAVSGQDIRDLYADSFNNARSRSDSLIEATIGRLIAERFPEGACVRLPAWTVHQPFKPKLYLRKSQSTQDEYVRAGLDASVADLREWSQIERENYLCRPSCV